MNKKADAPLKRMSVYFFNDRAKAQGCFRPVDTRRLMGDPNYLQREQGEWILHTLMVEGCDVPFKFKRIGKYQSLKGARVNITYYPEQQVVAGITFEVMKVVRIKKG